MGFSILWIVLLLCAIIAFISYFCDKMHRASICLWDKHTLFLTLMIPFLALDMVNIFFSPFSGFLDMFLLLRSFSLDNKYKDENEMMTWIHMFGGKSHVSWKNEKKVGVKDDTTLKHTFDNRERGTRFQVYKLPTLEVYYRL